MKSADRVAFEALIVLLAMLVFGLFSHDSAEPASFKAFYCAGKVLDLHGDPYLVEPLRSCEHSVSNDNFPQYAVEPAPLPNYALAPWALIARLPFRFALSAYFVLVIVALAAIGIGIAALTKLPLFWSTLPFLAQWLLNLRYGEIPPFATAGIVLCAWSIRAGRWWFAALSACLVALEPTLAVPLWLALLVFAARSRLPLIATGAALIALDVAIGGPARAIEYFSPVLPLQALSEVHANDQFSLTHQLALLGVSNSTAILLGSISYVVMIVIGMATAWRLSVATGSYEYLALAPPAFVLLGGTYVHDLQYMAALPLAIVLLARRNSTVLGISALLLAVTWSSGLSRIACLIAAVSAGGVAWIYAHQRSHWVQAATICVTLAVIVATFALNLRSEPTQPLSSPSASVSATTWAPIDWQIYLEASPSRTQPSIIDLSRKLPIWVAMILLLCDSLVITFGRAAPQTPPFATASRRAY
jgi:hypothetical protein